MENQADNFTTGSIPRKLIKFMFPILGALVLQAMYGAVDMIIVGKFGTTEGLSAVSTGSAVINFVTMVISGLTMGITVLIGRYIGEKAPERIREVVGGAVCFFGILAIVFTLIMVIPAKFIVSLMQAPTESFALTVQYVQICGMGLVFIIGYNVISGIFRGMGNSGLPLVFVAVACVANVLLDLLFIAVWHMNVAGAALATVLAQAISVILSFLIIRKQSSLLFITIKDIRFNKEIKKFCKLGLPITLQSGLSNISFLLICAIINNLGLAASSGYGVAQKINGFIMLLPGTLMQSISAFVAQNMGAGLPQRAKKATWFGMMIGVSIGVIIFYTAFFHGDFLAKLFSDDEVVIGKTAEYLKGFSPEPIITCISFSLIGYFNGRGKTMFTMIQGLIQAFLVRIPITWFMSRKPDVTLTDIGVAVPAATMCGILMCVIYYVVLEKRSSSEN